MRCYNNEISVDQQFIIPKSLKGTNKIQNADSLFVERIPSVSFSKEEFTVFDGKGAYVVLDFGKEIAGGVRIITREVCGNPIINIRFGESLSECLTGINVKNSTNDHSPRDFNGMLSMMSDLTFGQTGFRFVRIELLDDVKLRVQNIFAVNNLQHFDFEGKIITDDEKLNRIIETAMYTLKLNFQNGFIWDGIKRDRLVWSGDLNQEIVTSLYMFGNTPNVKNSISYLREDTESGCWINDIPTYSAWWVINLLDYCKLSGDIDYYNENKDYLEEILDMVDKSIDKDGNIAFIGNAELPFYLDWPTFEQHDAQIGTAAVFLLMAKKCLQVRANEAASSICRKLGLYLEKRTDFKQTLAFQVLAGRKKSENDLKQLEYGGSKGFSTFLSYYILSALADLGSDKTLDIVKEYFGGMLSVGATTFWEDFDIDWLENCNELDRLPIGGEKDIHGDFGRYCYKNFRHSLCHGWSSGVVSFIIEKIIGLEVYDGWKRISVSPNCAGLEFIDAKIASPYGEIAIYCKQGVLKVNAPKEIEIAELKTQNNFQKIRIR